MLVPHLQSDPAVSPAAGRGAGVHTQQLAVVAAVVAVVVVVVVAVAVAGSGGQNR